MSIRPSRGHLLLLRPAYRPGLALALLLAPLLVLAQGSGSPAMASRAASAKAGSATGWAALTPAQQAALQPLGPSWSGMSADQQRKWLALARNFEQLSPSERSLLHGRMTEWANLSPVQRSQARLNFAQTKELSTDQKKAEWQAYQALPLEQRQRLAAGGPILPRGAAPALQPVDPSKLVPVPRASGAAGTRARPARAASTPAARP